MSKLREEYDRFQSERERWLQNRMTKKYFIEQERRYVHPFRIFGNVWYVGDSWVCVHLIDTGDGLLLIDCGNCGGTSMLVQAIWEAGFNPADVKWIVLSHGHLDHIGGALFFRRMFGTRLYLGEPDSRDFREHPELSLIQDAGDLNNTVFEPDHEILDGEVIRFGNTEINFFLVPGHTAGCIAAFFDVKEGDRKVRAGYYGGFGFNTLQKDFLDDVGDKGHTMRNTYLESLAKVRNQKVELFLGNHCINNNTLERAERLKAGDKDAFIDDKAWGNYLDSKRDALLNLMNDPSQN
ncbi:MAG: MBL fold metallo-hydrolase [Spirochaetales bacterium]|nr:MBL fold metallo-hydrolase [Spirochaetales bacterium]